MGSVKEYFSSFANGFVSLLKGMQVTGKEFVTPKITERYPEDRTTRPAAAPRFRAILTLKYDDEGNHKCIACGTCERVCPNQTIRLNTKMVDTLKGKKKKLVDYNYDLGSCTFCQLCVTNCPTDALDFSNDFEQAVFTRDKLVKKLNYLPEKPEPEPTPEEIAAYKAEQEKKIAAAEAAAAAKKAAAEAGAKPAAPAAEAPKAAEKPAAAPEKPETPEKPEENK